jgi:hypothetical protein
VTAVDRWSGAIVWSVRPAGVGGVGIQSSPSVSVDGMVVCVVTDAGVVYSLWAESGALISSTVTAGAGRVPITNPVGFPGSVALDARGNVLIGGCYDNSNSVAGQSAGYRTECVYQSPGRWVERSDTIPGYHAELGGFDPSVHAHSVTKAGSIVSSSVSGASYIVFTRFQGAVAASARVQVLVAFDTSTGGWLWDLAFPLASSWGDGSLEQMPFADTGVALGADGTLVFASLDGKVYALRDCGLGTGDSPADPQTSQPAFRCSACFGATYNNGRFRQCQPCVAGE